jgi:hypothetical protein
MPLIALPLALASSPAGLDAGRQMPLAADRAPHRLEPGRRRQPACRRLFRRLQAVVLDAVIRIKSKIDSTLTFRRSYERRIRLNHLSTRDASYHGSG